uniref:Uncharacterized protein n=1 Tax=Glossina palpalis gambiensis TaxID=67801 RepID=A0A1B0BWG7_9MUSC
SLGVIFLPCLSKYIRGQKLYTKHCLKKVSNEPSASFSSNGHKRFPLGSSVVVVVSAGVSVVVVPGLEVVIMVVVSGVWVVVVSVAFSVVVFSGIAVEVVSSGLGGVVVSGLEVVVVSLGVSVVISGCAVTVVVSIVVVIGWVLCVKAVVVDVAVVATSVGFATVEVNFRQSLGSAIKPSDSHFVPGGRLGIAVVEVGCVVVVG